LFGKEKKRDTKMMEKEESVKSDDSDKSKASKYSNRAQTV
jgi:hypothetical protein